MSIATKPLADTDVLIPEIGIGTWDYRAGIEPIRTGLEAGALFIDTAESYGNEEVVGRAVAGRRREVFLATKVSAHNLKREALLKAADNSLRLLATDWIDLYQIHRPNTAIPIEETLGAMEELVDAGKVRFIGVSNFTVAQLRDAQKAMRKHRIMSNQVRFNLIDRTICDGLLAFCQKERVTVIAYSPLARGFHHILDNDPGGVLAELGRVYKRTPVQVALNWCLGHPGVVAIPKGNSAAHVQENCGGSGWKLSPEDFSRLTDAITFRRRGSLDAFVRSHIPPGGKELIQFVSRLMPRALRRRIN